MTSGVTPHITIRDGRAAAAIAFYETAFGAVEMMRVMSDDNHRIIFAQLHVNGGMMMLSDQFSESDCAAGQAPVHVEGIVIHLQVDDADAWWERALAAGADVRFPIGPQFWGDRYGQVADPFGYIWSIGSPATAH